LEHPALNEKTKPFILQYVKNLKIRQKGVKMAITDEEKKMALALYENIATYLIQFMTRSWTRM